jgi:hypothetical protein
VRDGNETQAGVAGGELFLLSDWLKTETQPNPLNFPSTSIQQRCESDDKITTGKFSRFPSICCCCSSSSLQIVSSASTNTTIEEEKNIFP